ncbi:MAG: DNA polymerase III subunit alpha, partial [Acetobacteraceae bacterium]|nr:DNA polymerase III subunit alpha [Acetobacteraceae bacterium]
LSDWPPMERLAFEQEAIGFHLTAHPLDIYREVLRRLGVVPLRELEARAAAGEIRVKLAGVITGSKERTTRTGSRMAWVRISDTTGSVEVTFFSETLGRGRDLLTAGASVLVTAELRLDGDALRITAQDAASLGCAAADVGAGMRIWLERTEAVPHIRDLLGREGRGRGRVILVPRLDVTQSVEIALPGGFNVTPRLAQALKLLPGVERVEDF